MRVNVGDANECWEWSGYREKCGYGRLCVDNVRWLAHRFAYSSAFGSIPAGMDVCHRCDNPPCCNPAHLFVGTHADNMRDKVAKVRSSVMCGEAAPNAKLTAEDVRLIRALRAQGWTLAQIGDEVNTHLSNVSLILRGRAWAHVA